MEVASIIKAATFKSFLQPSYENSDSVTVLFNISMRQTLTDDFWRLHKSMNCTFPLSLQLTDT